MTPSIAELSSSSSTPVNEVSVSTTSGLAEEQPSKTSTASTWQAIATRRQQEILSSIPSEWILPADLLKSKRPLDLVKTCGLLNEREVKIVYSTAVDLLERMRTRECTAVEVTTAFCKASAVAHQATNCLAWTMYPSALSHAAKLDAHMSQTGTPIGPLHGLPISVKEHIYLIDTPSTSGFVGWADNFCTSPSQEGMCIQVLRNSGAVFHVKTTNPQGLMALETRSNLYSTTTNPLNTFLSPGGSSGGESALIAMHGSILGIGTDIGGSIRSPALSCGIYGLKPSVARLPHSGLSGAHDGMESVIGVVGPIATCLADVELFCKTLLDAQPWRGEVGLLSIPWGCRESLAAEKEENRKLKIGIIYTDGVHTPHPPITRVLHTTESTLKEAGHEIIPFPTHLHAPLISTVDAMYLLDGGAEYLSHLSLTSEPPTSLLQWILEKKTTKNRTVPEQWKLHKERNRIQDEYAKLMLETGVDCIIAPGGVTVANAHEEAKYWGYTSVFNGLDLPVACLPAGEVEDSDVWGDADGNESGKTDMEALWGPGNEGAQKYEGGSVGLQIVGRRLEEEKLLKMVRIIERDLGLSGSD
ncbi:putative fatty-acid amide hydrolase protein [Botrytis fragariae]|uniref:amidase n=1 Tax=Botrytis fragariae TaxID=1964551 RepID=A0A8H6AXR1_9HELO|nr:putative fatty-acid amide hydrolase protein [Botrytis fragariae]KAF5875738.1 putative fatty-acid amide hydrolase protein [Botrytis fragariae]